MVDEQFLGIDHVPDRDDGKCCTVGFSGRRIFRRRAGRSLAPADHIRADHKIPVGVERLARTDNRIPPARLILSFMKSRNMGIAGECMADKNGIVPLPVQLPICLIGNG